MPWGQEATGCRLRVTHPDTGPVPTSWSGVPIAAAAERRLALEPSLVAPLVLGVRF